MEKHKHFEAAKQLALETGKISMGLLLEKFSIGCNSASYLLDELEEAKVIAPYDGGSYRKVILKRKQDIK